MPTPSDPNECPSSAKTAVPGPSSDATDATDAKPLVKASNDDLTGELPIPVRSGSTDSHKPGKSGENSDFILKGSSARHRSPESDIAQFLAHPQAVPDNTDDSPTVITQGNQGNSTRPQSVLPPTQPLPIIVTGEVPSIAGRRLGHFELIEAVGAGGMAAVLKARDTELGRIVALKILPPDAARDSESVNRFKQEARAAAALDHENIARVYYCGEDQGLHFIAFEFVEGINLRQMIDRRGVLPAAECVRYMMQVAAGLNHAAERGVVHRDIKPSNILITPDGRAKIVDMGLARHLGSELVNGGVTQSGVTLGTFDYISPEQALDPRRADVRSDIYSLGCTFYHALTGRPPVPEGTAARKLRAHQNEQPLDPRELNPSIPDELAAVLARMMAKDPAQRYQSPVELIAYLKGLAERLNLGNDALAHDSAAKMVPAERHLLPSPPRFHPVWVLAFAAIAIAVVAFVIATSNPSPAPIGPTPQAKATDPASGDKSPKPAPGMGLGKHQDVPVRASVKTADELADLLEDPTKTKVVIELEAGDFDLTKLTKPRPVVFHGKSVELIGKGSDVPGGLTRIILSTSDANGDHKADGSLTLKAAGPVTVRNVRFEMNLDPEVLADDVTDPVGLRIEDTPKVDFVDCVFAPDDRLRSHKARSVWIKPRDPRDGVIARESPRQVSILRCLFSPNADDGIVLPHGSTVNVTDSGFGPHTSVFFLAEGSGATEINLDHCTFMVDPRGSVVEGASRVTVNATDCLFAPVSPNSNGTNQSGTRVRFASSSANANGVVIRTRGETTEGLELRIPPGRVAGFYYVDPFGTPTQTFSSADWKKKTPEIKDAARELRQRPWAETDPLAMVASDNPWKAFKLRVEGSAELDPAIFTQDSLRRSVPLGVAFYNPDDKVVRRAYPDLISVWGSFPLKKTVEVKKIWWPDATPADMAPGVYAELKTLLRNVRPDETIYIHHTGELKVDNEEIKAATKPSDGEPRLKFMPDDGSRPILVIEGDTDTDQSLFKLKAGEVTFEGLHFRLKPNLPRNTQVAAAVNIIGGKGCTFEKCVFTLAEEDDSHAAIVYLTDPTKMMAMDPATRTVPKIVFKHCLIRGGGRVVWVDVSRPIHLEMSNTLTALDGPVIFTSAKGMAPANATSNVKFTNSTVLAGGPVIEMRGDKTAATRLGGLVKFDVDTDACLFVAVPNAGRPLVDVDSVDPADWKNVLNWHVAPTKGNRYANFDEAALSQLAIIKSGGDGTSEKWNRGQWIDNIGEPMPDASRRFGEIKFATTLTGLKDLATTKPADVVVKSMDFADLTGASTLEVGVKPTELQESLKLLLSEMKPE